MLKEKVTWPFTASSQWLGKSPFTMRKNYPNKLVSQLRDIAAIEPESNVWMVAEEPRYDHMARVARDARTFLGALTANVDWVRSNLVDHAAPAGLMEGFADIEACCARLNNLLDEALLGTRQHGLSVRRSVLSVGSVLSAALKQVRGAADSKRVTIEVSTDHDIAAMMDRALVTRAIGKLLEHVVAVSEPGDGVVIRYQLEKDDIIIVFSRKERDLLALPASHEARRPGQPRLDGADLDFCHVVAESHRGSLTVGSGFTLYRLALPWVGPGTL